MVTNFTIYGERCSGTNYLEQLILENFELPVTWKYGWKHFFGFSNLENSDDTLFFGIVRSPIAWFDSFLKILITYHHKIKTLKNFLQIAFTQFIKMKL